MATKNRNTLADYYKAEVAAWANYYKAMDPAQAGYYKAEATAWANYYKAMDPAQAGYYKAD